MSTISKRKQKRSDIEAYYRNERKTFWFGPLKIGTDQNILVWSEFFCIKSSSFPFWPISSGTKRTNLIWSNCLRRSGTFLCNKKTYRPKQMVLIWFPYYWNESKTFWFGLLVFRTEEKYFDLVCLLSELKQSVLIWSAYYLNKSNTFWFGLLIIGTKAKQFDLLLKLSQQLYSIRRFLFDPYVHVFINFKTLYLEN